MKTNLVAIYDRVTKQYSNLMCHRAIERIQQEFDDVCANPDSVYYKNPSEYEVHHIGIFNDSPEHDPDLKNELFPRPNVIATGKSRANS